MEMFLNFELCDITIYTVDWRQQLIMIFKHLVPRSGCKLFIDCWEFTTIKMKMLQFEILWNLHMRWRLDVSYDVDDRNDKDDDDHNDDDIDDDEDDDGDDGNAELRWF